MKNCTTKVVGFGACVHLKPLPIVLEITLPKRVSCEHLPPGEWSADRMRREELCAGWKLRYAYYCGSKADLENLCSVYYVEGQPLHWLRYHRP